MFIGSFSNLEKSEGYDFFFGNKWFSYMCRHIQAHKHTRTDTHTRKGSAFENALLVEISDSGTACCRELQCVAVCCSVLQ